MAYSDNFPATRPVFQADFANGGRIDPRATFSRSDSPIDATKAAASAVHFWSNEKHLSSENLFVQSSDFDTSWTLTGINGTPTGGQTDPSGGTDGFTVVEASGGTYHRVHQIMTPTGDLALTVYAKQNSGSRYLCLSLYHNSPITQNFESAVFDLAGGAVATLSGASSTFTSVSTSQTASGNGYYKCVLKATGTIANANINLHNSPTTAGLSSNNGLPTYSGDGSSSLDLAYASLTSTGATDYQATTTSIHRQYAPTLKSPATAGQPRFEYDPTDGQSMGVLIESQATNINTYSKGGVNGSGVVQWQVDNGSATGNSAVGPDGTLSALHFVPNTTTTAHYVYNNVGSAPSGSTPHTISVYAKAAGESDIAIRLTSSYSAFANTINATFTLTGDGSVSVTGGTATAAIESCGNGWYRCQVTETTDSSPTGMRPYIYARQVASYAGDGFSGVLLWGWQVEANSFASSFVDTGTGGSTTTRAADSLSMTDSSIFNGGEHSVYWEGTVNGSTDDPRLMELSDGTSANRIQLFHNDGNKVMLRTTDSGATQGAMQISELMTGNSKVVATLKTSEARLVRNGSTITSSTSDSFYSPSGLRKINIGTNYAQGSQLDGHVKRVAYYNTALTQTQAEALSS